MGSCYDLSLLLSLYDGNIPWILAKTTFHDRRVCIRVARVLRYYAGVRGAMILRPLPGIQVRPGYQDTESKTGLLKILFFIQANMMQDPVHFSKYIVNE